MADDDILVADTGYMAAWTTALYPLRRPGRAYLAGGRVARLGGARRRRRPAGGRRAAGGRGSRRRGHRLSPDRDGDSRARCAVPAVVVVLNDGCLAFEYHEQKMHWDNQVVDTADDFLPAADYAAAARALGARGSRVTSRATSTRRCAGRSTPAATLIDVVTDHEPLAPVTNYDDIRPRQLTDRPMGALTGLACKRMWSSSGPARVASRWPTCSASTGHGRS